MADDRGLWGMVLAGGEGVRLRPLVQEALGEDRPKQYVKLLGPRSLLRQTLDRVALGISGERIVVVTVRRHTAYIGEEFAGSSQPPYVLVQPDDRGTAAAILYAAHWIAWRDPAATVAIFPSDHFILGEATFMAHVTEVARSLERHPDRVVLLGAPPISPEGEYGWIEPGSPIDGHDGVLSTVCRFWEKPSEARVQLCLTTGCLWNTAIVVARAGALVRLGAEALPEMSARLARIERFLDSEGEAAAVHQAYALMSKASFSRAVLEPHPERLGVSRLPRVTWCDLGSPRRVLDVLARMRVRPALGRPAGAGSPAGCSDGGPRGPLRHRALTRSRGMPSTLWTGSISFGLVNIPVSLVTAEKRDELDFTLLDKHDDSPIGYQKVSKRTGKPVPSDRIVRGFEYSDGRYVIVSDADLRRASPERTQRIDILSFVEAAEIPPIHFDRPYYLEPARGGERGYALFRAALRRSGRVAVASVVVKTRQHLAAVLPHDRVLVLNVLRYASELRDPSRLRVPGDNLKALRVSDREIKMAERLVDEMTEDWRPEKYHDEYRDELLAFIKKRGRAGKLAAAPETEEKPAKPRRADVIDIAELLKRSLARTGEDRRRPRRRKSA